MDNPDDKFEYDPRFPTEHLSQDEKRELPDPLAHRLIRIGRRVTRGPRRLHVDSRDAEHLAKRARASNTGEALGTHVTRWSLQGDCLRPNYIEVLGRPYSGWTRPRSDFPYHTRFGRVSQRNPYHTVEMFLRCRKCGPCREVQRRTWKVRALRECSKAARTWFSTLTIRPSDRFLLLVRAQVRAKEKGFVWETLPDERKHRFVSEIMGVETTLYLKRLRKNTKIPGVRYLLVFEQHKDGSPHAHMLIHEPPTHPGQLTHAKLEEAWRLGFTKFQLLTGLKAADYTTKYISKSLQVRIRASRRYGLETAARS